MASASERSAADPGYATDARYQDGWLYVTLSTGRVIREPGDRYEWLAAASPGARAHVEVADFGTVIRWPDLDADLGVASILGVTEEEVARSAGFEVRSRRRVVAPQPASASLSSPSPSRRDRTKSRVGRSRK
jgi:hypothetical protein